MSWEIHVQVFVEAGAMLPPLHPSTPKHLEWAMNVVVVICSRFTKQPPFLPANSFLVLSVKMRQNKI